MKGMICMHGEKAARIAGGAIGVGVGLAGTAASYYMGKRRGVYEKRTDKIGEPNAKGYVGSMVVGGLTGPILYDIGRSKGRNAKPEKKYNKGDVWDNPDDVVAGKEYKAFHRPKEFCGE